MRAMAAVLLKDVVVELRGPMTTTALATVSLLVLVVLVFAFGPVWGQSEPTAAAGALWVALVVSGTLGGGRVVAVERERRCIDALVLSPLDRGGLFLAKSAAAFVFILVAEGFSLIVALLFFNLAADAALARTAAVLALGAVGFAGLVTLVGAVGGRAKGRDCRVPLLAVPLYVPALIAGVKASADALGGARLGEIALWLKVLLSCDAIFVAAGLLLFEQVVAGSE